MDSGKASIFCVLGLFFEGLDSYTLAQGVLRRGVSLKELSTDALGEPHAEISHLLADSAIGQSHTPSA